MNSEELRKQFNAACGEGFNATAEHEDAFKALEAAAVAPAALDVVGILTLIKTLLTVIPNIQTVLDMLLAIFKPQTA